MGFGDLRKRYERARKIEYALGMGVLLLFPAGLVMAYLFLIPYLRAGS